MQPAQTQPAVPAVTQDYPDIWRKTHRLGRTLAVGASRIGKSHVQAGSHREDAFHIVAGSEENPSWFAVAVADGLGSCPFSRVGANFAVGNALSYIRAQPQGLLSTAPRTVVSMAAYYGLAALRKRAEEMERPERELSCTLLLLLCVKRDDGYSVATFQAGDGLIAAATWEGALTELAKSDDFAFSGEVHPLNSRKVQETWEERSRVQLFKEPPHLLLVMSDGVADDLVPWKDNGPILVGELSKALAAEDPGEALLNVLAYEKKGSFDDRTLVFVPLTMPVETSGLAVPEEPKVNP